jgi:uncharacterized protein (TIGR02145 family)
MKKVVFFLFFLTAIMNLSGQNKFTDPRDGNVYKTVTFNNVTWMGENLRYLAKEGADIVESDNKVNLEYGVLYDWKTSMKVCPDGWSLPTGEDFQALVNYFNQKDGWVSKGPNTQSFGIQLAGMKDYEGTFTEMDESAYLWTSTEYDKDNAEYFSYTVVVNTPVVDLSRKDDISDLHGSEKANKYSVRCIKK